MKRHTLASVKLPLFLLWFVIAFGVICLIPWHPSKSGELLPLGTPYVNHPRLTNPGTRQLLAAHVLIALSVAALVDVTRRLLRKYRRG